MSTRIWLFLFPLGLAAAAVVSTALQRPAVAAATLPVPYLGLGHTEPVSGIAWSPDGKTLATSSADAVVLWDVATGRPRATLSGYTGSGAGIAWSPDGKTLVCADKHTADLWDAASARRRARLSGYSGYLSSLAWGRDGKTLIGFSQNKAVVWKAASRQTVSHMEGSLSLWDGATGKLRSRIKFRPGLAAADMVLGPDGRTLAISVGYPNVTVTLWDARTGQRRATLEGSIRDLGVLTWSPDGKGIAGAAPEGAVLWDVETGRRRATFPREAGADAWPTLAWSPDGKTLAVASSEAKGVISLWNPATGKRRVRIGGFFDVQFLTWSPGGQTLASLSVLGAILWDPASGARRATLPVPIWPVAWSPDGRVLATGSHGSEVAFWDAFTGRCRAPLVSHGAVIYRLAWRADGGAIAAGTRAPQFTWSLPIEGRCSVTIWNSAAGRSQATLTGLPARVYALSWRPNQTTLAVAAGDYGPLQSTGIEYAVGPPWVWRQSATFLWDPAASRHQAPLEGATPPVAWSPDGKLLATGSGMSDAVIWDPSTEKRRATLHIGQIPWDLAWSPDGSSLAVPSSTKDGFAYELWGVGAQKPRARLQVASGYFSELAWSPDGATIACSVDERRVTLWDAATGTLRQTLTWRTPVPQDWLGWMMAQRVIMAWSPDGKLLATGLPQESVIKLWRATGGQLAPILTGPGANAGLLQWRPDGRTLACAYQNRTVILWDPVMRNARAILRGPTGQITAMAWSPDGRTLATGSEDGSLRLWDGTTGKERVALYSLDRGREWLAITPAGYFVASAPGSDVIQWRQGAKLWPVAKFRRFERPDLVRRALAG